MVYIMFQGIWFRPGLDMIYDLFSLLTHVLQNSELHHWRCSNFGTDCPIARNVTINDMGKTSSTEFLPTTRNRTLSAETQGAIISSAHKDQI